MPFVAKATGVPIAKIAARLMAGEKLADFSASTPRERRPRRGQGSGLPFARFPGVDVILGPEMKSTGEVMGLDADFGRAFAKSQLGAGVELPLDGHGLRLGQGPRQAGVVEPCRRLIELGFKLVATARHGRATCARRGHRRSSGINKVLEGRPHIVDRDADGEVQLVFNTTEGAQAIADSFSLRRTALTNNIPYYTTVAGARAAVAGDRGAESRRLLKSPRCNPILDGSF